MKDLRERLAAQGVHTLIAQFTDLHGVARGKFVPLAHLDDLLTDGAGFSGPSIAGTGLPRCGPRSEYWGRGAASTATALPWLPGYARVACDGFVDGEPFDACPRQVLRRQVARLAARGWHLRTGIEPEFFLLRQTDGRWRPADAGDRLDKPSYDLAALQRPWPFLHELRGALEACGFEVLQIDHEDAHGQYELNWRHAEALASCDRLMLFKLAAQALAERHGRLFSMMPKPFEGQPGSGLHFHVSLWRDAATPADEATLGHFIGGVLAHARALAALAAPTVNSYKRLGATASISGTTWSPAVVAHGPNNRTAPVRTLPGRFEWRVPDASANVYLACATLVDAGLDGLARRLDPGPACTEDLSEVPRPDLPRLPALLDEALDALQADAVVAGTLGPELLREFVALKRAESAAWRSHVSDWERERHATAF